MNRILVSLCFAVASMQVVSAQSASETTVQALLTEVRQLRQALEKSAVVAPRIQVTLQRMQLQQEAVARATQSLARARDRLVKATDESVGIANETKALQATAARELDSARRTGIENQVKGMQTFTEQQRIMDLQLRATESELAGVLRTEQGKLDELTERLNALERSLEIQPGK